MLAGLTSNNCYLACSVVLTILLSEIEAQAEAYAKAKESKTTDLASISGRLVDAISSQDFILPLKPETVFANGTTTFVYESNSSYPALFAFIAEVLHTKVPVEIGSSKFGPSEILVKSASKEEANLELAKSLKELRQLVRAKKTEIQAKYSQA